MDNIIDTKSSGGVGKQVYTTLCVNLLTLSYGASIGWLSPALELLKNENSPLTTGPITVEETSFIGSASCVGGFIASCSYGWISKKLGRKNALITAAGPQMIGWILIYFATNPIYLIAARFCHGVGGGAAYIVIPLFVTEISGDKVRGRLGTMLVFFMSVGILIGYIVGGILDFKTTPLIFLVIPNVFLAGIITVHDSPMHLIRKSRFRRAENALRFYRGETKKEIEMSSKLKLEYDNMTCMIKMSNSDSSKGKITFGDFLTRPAVKAMSIGIVLMSLELFSGTFALLSYASLIFEEAGSKLSPNLSAIIVGATQVIGVYCSTIFVDRVGRRALMFISSFGCALGLACFGTYSLLQNQGFDWITTYNWIPVTSVSFVIFAAYMGVVSLNFLIVTEITPLKIKDVVYSINLSFSWFLAFIELQFMPACIAIIGISGTMLILSALCFLGSVYIIFYLPETKNKSIEEIQELMSK